MMLWSQPATNHLPDSCTVHTPDHPRRNNTDSVAYFPRQPGSDGIRTKR